MNDVPAEKYFTIQERRAVLRRRAAAEATVQRDLEDDSTWEYVDVGGEEW